VFKYSTHHPLDVKKKLLLVTLISLSHFYDSNQIAAQSSFPPSFDCYNMNCYRKFPGERGLCAHLWHSNSCKKNVSSERPHASCREVVADESQRHPGFGVQSARLNLTMSADAPLFSPYNEFDYDAFLGDLMMITLRLDLTTMTTMSCCCWWRTMNLLTSYLHRLL
jgi:hypothetical protein